MSAFWQAKIWGLLHDPFLKALHEDEVRGNSFWLDLDVMQDWREKSSNPETFGSTLLQHIHLADYITSASDRGAIGSVATRIDYAPKDNTDKGLEIFHLLSGAKLDFKLKQHSQLISNRLSYIQEKEQNLVEAIPASVKTDIKKLFWWLWRCLPEAFCDLFQEDSLMLMPADTSMPDSSIWSHGSLTAALAGALVGYELTSEQIEQRGSADDILSHPYLATFTFSPVQELIKASRKMRDFWAGSWILHYLSARVCWELAKLYGPDSFLYPNLYQQPLIDYWILKEWAGFEKWVEPPSPRSLLTAGFPNVIVLVLPKDKVSAAMATARQTVLETWRDLGNLVFQELHDRRHWMPQLQADCSTWKGWLDAQWQIYSTAIPIGKEEEPLNNTANPKDKFQPWLDTQNQAYNLIGEKEKLFQDAEIAFFLKAYDKHLHSVNVGSWWPYIFAQTRLALAAAKNARNWVIPTAFATRSTVSGLGPVVHPGKDWIAEGETKKYWQRQAGLFDGREQLNATETVKRGLEKILPKLFAKIEEGEVTEAIAASYPDLTAGVAGYLKVNADVDSHRLHFEKACKAVLDNFDWAEQVIKQMRSKWGIPWIDNKSHPKRYHPRLLNAGWLVEDAETIALTQLNEKMKKTSDPGEVEKFSREIAQLKIEYRSEIQQIIDRHYPSNNPADWYVLAAGDGDGMSEWLKGKKMKTYRDYIPSDLQSQVTEETFENFLNLPKRMGPSTHNALSRALLDFSNRLVPYLTEQRYAGRLIYGGGDDVLAYTNLWEWDNWLWDIRQCFRGDKDPMKEFDNSGDYWRWQSGELPPNLLARPLFTMGHTATISFGITIAHHSVPLAIALENLWEAEAEAKKHEYHSGCHLESQKDIYTKKDAVQVRILYSNGNILKATAKFDVFRLWQNLLTGTSQVESAIFEQAANLWSQHPAPIPAAIIPWTKAFVARRELFQGDDVARNNFQQNLAKFLNALWCTTLEKDREQEIQIWLKLAAFMLRSRDIKIGGGL